MGRDVSCGWCGHECVVGSADVEVDGVADEARREDALISVREEEVLQLVADGYGTNEIAERLYISGKTVKNHLASIYEKLNARDRTQAVLMAVKMGIVKLT